MEITDSCSFTSQLLEPSEMGTLREMLTRRSLDYGSASGCH